MCSTSDGVNPGLRFWTHVSNWVSSCVLLLVWKGGGGGVGVEERERWWWSERRVRLRWREERWVVLRRVEVEMSRRWMKDGGIVNVTQN